MIPMGGKRAPLARFGPPDMAVIPPDSAVLRTRVGWEDEGRDLRFAVPEQARQLTSLGSDRAAEVANALMRRKMSGSGK